MWCRLPSVGIDELDQSLASLNGVMHLYLHGLLPAAELESIPSSYQVHIDLEEETIKRRAFPYSTAHQEAHKRVLNCLQTKKKEWLSGQVTANDFVTYACSIIAQHVSEHDVNLKN